MWIVAVCRSQQRIMVFTLLIPTSINSMRWSIYLFAAAASTMCHVNRPRVCTPVRALWFIEKSSAHPKFSSPSSPFHPYSAQVGVRISSFGFNFNLHLLSWNAARSADRGGRWTFLRLRRRVWHGSDLARRGLESSGSKLWSSYKTSECNLCSSLCVQRSYHICRVLLLLNYLSTGLTVITTDEWHYPTTSDRLAVRLNDVQVQPGWGVIWSAFNARCVRRSHIIWRIISCVLFGGHDYLN